MLTDIMSHQDNTKANSVTIISFLIHQVPHVGKKKLFISILFCRIFEYTW